MKWGTLKIKRGSGQMAVLMLAGTIVGLSPIGGRQGFAAEPSQNQAPSTQGVATPTKQPVVLQPASTTIQAAPIEINASAPSLDPDPYALPSHAPEFLVKMRTDLEKSYMEHRSLANQMLDFLAASNFDVRSPGLGQGQSAVATYGELLRKLENLNSKIEVTEVEFIHEKQVFLAHGVRSSEQTASLHGAKPTTVQLVHDK